MEEGCYALDLISSCSSIVTPKAKSTLGSLPVFLFFFLNHPSFVDKSTVRIALAST